MGEDCSHPIYSLLIQIEVLLLPNRYKTMWRDWNSVLISFGMKPICAGKVLRQ